MLGKSRSERSLLRWCIRQEPRRLAIGMGCSVVLQAGLVAIPWCLKRALDDGIIAGDQRLAAVWALAIVGLGGLIVVAEVVRALTMRVAADSIGNRLRMRILRHVLALDQAALSRFGHGDLAMRATRDADLLHFWAYGLSLWAQLVTALVLVCAAIGTLEPVLLLVSFSTDSGVPGGSIIRAGSPGTSRTAKKVTVTTPRTTTSIWMERCRR